MPARPAMSRRGLDHIRIVRVTVCAYLVWGALTFAAWWITGYRGWLDIYFRYPGTVLLLAMPAVALACSLQVSRQFGPGEPLRTAWRLMALAAACDLVGTFSVHVLSAPLILDLFNQLVAQSRGPMALLRQAGVLVSGSVRFALVAAALLRVLLVYRRAKLLARLQPLDWLILAAVWLYLCLEMRETVDAVRGGLHLSLRMVLNWPTDPLLAFLALEALLLYRSARGMRPGMVGKVWQALSTGVFLVITGDFLLWAGRTELIKWPWSAVEWYVWVPAAAAFALTPLHQMEAMQMARSSRARTFS